MKYIAFSIAIAFCTVFVSSAASANIMDEIYRSITEIQAEQRAILVRGRIALDEAGSCFDYEKLRRPLSLIKQCKYNASISLLNSAYEYQELCKSDSRFCETASYMFRLSKTWRMP